MSQIKELFSKTKRKNITYATGLVRPKTTALFFDKIWLPSPTPTFQEFYGDIYSNIPKSVFFTETDIWRSEGHKYNHSGFDRYIVKKRSHRLESLTTDELFCRYSMRNYYLPIGDFLYSVNRNAGLQEVSLYFQKFYNIEVTPVFLDKTEFERCIIQNVSSKPGPVSVIEASIKSVPMIVEENLFWEQVEEIRKDEKSIAKLRKFRVWAMQNLEGKTQNQVTDIIGAEIEDYSNALKKHGILTVIGGFTTMLSSSATILEAINMSQPELIAAGIAVSAGIVTFAVKQVSDFFDARHHPIAFIYDVTKDASK